MASMLMFFLPNRFIQRSRPIDAGTIVQVESPTYIVDEIVNPVA